jgi:hypothetical protein
MKLAKIAVNTSVVIVSCFIAILLVEAIYKLSPKKEPESVYRWELRYMLLSNQAKGPAFRNIGNFYTYQPGAKIHNKAYYFVNDRWVKEYDYFLPTNNFGLVQANDIQADVPSMLLLGDSYTEGQGAPPWFEHFKKSNSQTPLQLVNGGLVGTGFQQWKLLHDYLTGERIKVEKLVVVYISGDYVRNVWNFPQRTLECLADYRLCEGGEDFYGMPPDDKVDWYLGKLRGYREAHLFRKESEFKKAIHDLFPGTRLALRFVRESLKKSRITDSPEIPANQDAIRQFIEAYKNNVLFVHIPQKDEILDHAVSPLGKMVRREIESFGGEYYDGQNLCGFTREDYFVNDGHPNEAGYAKVSACVTAAVSKKWPLQ